jgi:hypothetical protein
MADISKLIGAAAANIAKVIGAVKAAVSKVSGVTMPVADGTEYVPDERIYYTYWSNSDPPAGYTIYDMVDEGYATPNDADFMESSYAAATVKLGLVNTNLPGASYQFKVKARIAGVSALSTTFTLSVYTGTTLLFEEATAITRTTFDNFETAWSSPIACTAGEMNDLRVWAYVSLLAKVSVISVFIK